MLIPTIHTDYQNNTLKTNAPKHVRKIEGGCLDLFPCGRLLGKSGSYEQLLHSLHFDQLYASGVGGPLFKHFKNVIRESGLYDYILIDSRTGLSDECGICTRDLADHIIVIMGLNRQNVDGTTRFLTQLKSSNWQEGSVEFILSPVPSNSEEKLRDARVREAKKSLRSVGFSSELDVRVPYHPRLALDEEPFLFNWTGMDIFSSWEQIQSLIRKMAQDSPERTALNLSEAFSSQRYDESLRLLRVLNDDDPPRAAGALTTLLGNFTEPSEHL